VNQSPRTAVRGLSLSRTLFAIPPVRWRRIINQAHLPGPPAIAWCLGERYDGSRHVRHLARARPHRRIKVPRNVGCTAFSTLIQPYRTNLPVHEQANATHDRKYLKYTKNECKIARLASSVQARVRSSNGCEQHASDKDQETHWVVCQVFRETANIGTERKAHSQPSYNCTHKGRYTNPLAMSRTDTIVGRRIRVTWRLRTIRWLAFLESAFFGFIRHLRSDRLRTCKRQAAEQAATAPAST